jgi:Chaperone of endosialidase
MFFRRRLWVAFATFPVALIFATAVLAQTLGGACPAVNTSTSIGNSSMMNNLFCIGGVWVLETVQPGVATAPCASGTAGQIQWTGSALQYCNGSNWTNIGTSGSSGITLGTSASATNPQRSGDVTTGEFSPATGAWAVGSGGTEEMRVTSSGVGIGTTAPGTNLEIVNNGGPALGVNNGAGGSETAIAAGTVPSTSGTGQPNITFATGYNYSSTSYGWGVFYRTDNGNFDIWAKNGSAGAASPVLTLQRSNGNVGIGTAAPAEPLEIYSSGAGVLLQLAGSSGTCNHTPGSSSETVSCSSDRRLKSDLIDAPSALPWLSSIRVRDFIWKNTGQKRTGVIAQELQKTHPEMVTYNGGTDEWTVEQPNPWTLVKVLQEQQAEIDDLKKQLTAKH